VAAGRLLAADDLAAGAYKTINHLCLIYQTLLNAVKHDKSEVPNK